MAGTYRDTRAERLKAKAVVNLRRSAGQPDKVDQMARGLRLLAASHLGNTSGEHFFKLELNLRPLMNMTCSPQWPSASD